MHESNLLKALTFVIAFIMNGVVNNMENLLPLPSGGWTRISYAQRQMYLAQSIEPDTIAYNVTDIIEVIGELKIARLERAMNEVLAKYDILRTSFTVRDGELLQKVEEGVAVAIECDVLQYGLEEEVRKFIRPFRLEKPPLLRVKWLEGKTRRYLLIDVHHIITDRRSHQNFVTAVCCRYNGTPVNSSPIQYRDYVSATEELQNSRRSSAEQFWRRRLKPALSCVNRKPFLSYAGKPLCKALLKYNGEVVAPLRQLCMDGGCSVNAALLSSFLICWAKHTRSKVVSVGVPVDGRRPSVDDNQLGVFVNTLPFVSVLNVEMTCIEFLKATMSEFIGCVENQHVDLDELIARCLREMGGGNAPLYEAAFEFNNGSSKHIPISLDNGRVTLRSCGSYAYESKLGLFVMAYLGADTLEVYFESSAEHLANDNLQCFASMYNQILRRVIEEPESELRALLPELSARNIDLACVVGREDLRMTAPSIITRFDAQARLYSDRPAVQHGSLSTSYGSMALLSKRIAAGLKKYNIHPGSAVAVLLERSEILIGVALGIWRINCVYLPIDPQNPLRRIRRMCEIARVDILIYNGALEIPDFEQCGKIKISVDDLLRDELYLSEDFQLAPSDPAYIIFTSGSTGEPKGAVVRHAGMINHILAKIEVCEINEDTILAQNASQGFDISIWQFFAVLLRGGKVIVYSDEVVLAVGSFLDRLRLDGVTVLELVPAYMSLIVQEQQDGFGALPDLRHCVVQGEMLTSSLAGRWLQHNRHATLVNAWGATETSDDVTHWVVSEALSGEIIPIGVPIPNTSVYIVDDEFRICERGVKGEICVGGIAVCAGYINDEEKTSRAFISILDPRGVVQPVYRTGDIGRILRTGEVEIFGRIDSQVKINGHRIEIGEVERVIAEVNGVADVVVVVEKQLDGNSMLAAYIRSAGSAISHESLLTEIRERLPEYMVPRAIQVMSSFPLTANGKVDRQRLVRVREKPPVSEITRSVDDDLEQMILVPWREVLRNEALSSVDDFFYSGGHSLAALSLCSRLRNRAKIEVSVKEVFENPTVRKLARHIKTRGLSGALSFSEPVAVATRSVDGVYPLSPIQLPIWYLLRVNPLSSFYHIAMSYELEGFLQTATLLNVVNRILAVNDIFQVAFEQRDGQPVQVFKGVRELSMAEFYRDVTLLGPEEFEREIKRQLNGELDLSAAPVARFVLYKVSNAKHLFTFVVSHIIWDQLSSIEFCKQLASGYNKALRGEVRREAENKIGYLDYVKWHHDLLVNGKLQIAKKYWTGKFENMPSPLDLPTDFVRPRIQSFRGGRVSCLLSDAEKRKIDTFCVATGTTYQIYFLTVLSVWIVQMSGQRDFVVGTPMSCRINEGLEKTLGLFAAALPIRCSLENATSFDEFLEVVKVASLEAYEHHLYPVAQIIQDAQSSNRAAHNQFIKVFFGVQNDESELSQVRLEGLEYGGGHERLSALADGTSHFDWTFQVDQSPTQLKLTLNYSSDLYTETSALRQIDELHALARVSIDNHASVVTEFTADTGDGCILQKALSPHRAFPASEATLHRCWKSIEENADRIALVAPDGEEIAYSTLGAWIDDLIQSMFDVGVSAGNRVAIFLPPSIESVVAVLACLKAGICYVPLAHDDPIVRVEEIIERAKPKLVLTSFNLFGNTLSEEKRKMAVDVTSLLEPSSRRYRVYHPELSRDSDSADSLAYLIFTSGTTGLPKGIEISRRGLADFVESTVEYYKLTESDAILFWTPISFDASVIDIIVPITVGAKVVVVDYRYRKDMSALYKVTKKYGVTLVQFVPSALHEFVTAATESGGGGLSLRWVICGGSAMSKQLCDRFMECFRCDLSNNYGPTETVVDASRFNCRDPYLGDMVPLGRPVRNTNIIIASKEGAILPIGAVGEICIARYGAFRGYFEKEGADCSSFRMFSGYDMPFFKTGDLGRIKVDGNLYFHGRNDNQLKIRGNRVEVEEVEMVVRALEYVKDVAVINSGSLGKDRLSMMVELHRSYRLSGGELGEFGMYTASQAPYHKRGMRALHLGAWPALFAGSPVLRSHWANLIETFANLQMCIVDGRNMLRGVVNAVALMWNGTNSDLPLGWDDAVVRALMRVSPAKANTLVVLAAIVDPVLRGTGLSGVVLTHYFHFAATLGFRNVLVALRPLGKERHQEIALEDYVERHKSGLLTDGWIRLHERLGGKIIGCSPISQFVRGTRAEWREWLGEGVSVPEGCNCVSAALGTVQFDPSNDVGVYYDPCVWIHHTPPEKTRCQLYPWVSADRVRTDLALRLPSYAIPERISFYHPIPRTASGKLDQAAVRKTDLEWDDLAFAPAGTPTESKLLELFGEVLGKPIDNVFLSFFDGGGHSLTVIRLVHLIRSRFGVDVTIADVWARSSTSELASHLDSLMASNATVV